MSDVSQWADGFLFVHRRCGMGAWRELLGCTLSALHAWRGGTVCVCSHDGLLPLA
tara:strand:+ start:388 stop:552 length:165 start_codon:yes stop_codon:yes gene_type:complete